MLLRPGIVFFICDTFLHLANAEVYCLLYDDEDLPLSHSESSSYRFQYCYRRTQKCCGTDCCDRPPETDYTWLMVVGGAIMIICICIGLVSCCKYLMGSTDNAPDNTNSLRMNTNQIDRRRELTDLEINTALMANRHEAAVQESNNHPITPPPAYNVAILAPSAPALLPENRVPSYEDVMAGKRT